MVGKLNHFEGLRGICCSVVIIDHCFNSFASWARHNGNGSPGWQKLIANTPLNLIYSGITSVYIFFLMSAFVLSIGYFKYGDNYIPGAALRRFPRLVLPCIGAACFYYFCIELANLFTSNSYHISIKSLIYEAAYLAPLKGDVRFNGPLWTISWEVYGSFLIFAMLALFGKTRFFGLFCLIAIVWYLDTNYLPFIVGMTASWFIAEKKSPNLPKIPPLVSNSIAIFSLAIAAFLMSYPFQRDGIVIPVHHQLLSWTGNWPNDYRNNVMAGAVMLFFVVCSWKPAQKFLSHNYLIYIGRISFSAYLLHQPIIIVTNTILPYGENSNIQYALLKIAIVLLVTFLTSIVFEKYVDRLSVKISSWLSRFALTIPKAKSLTTKLVSEPAVP